MMYSTYVHTRNEFTVVKREHMYRTDVERPWIHGNSLLDVRLMRIDCMMSD